MSKNRNEKENTDNLPIRSVWIGDIGDDDWLFGIIQEIITLDLEDNSKPIYLFINSNGGRTESMAKIRNLLLENISSPIITVGIINVKSAACSIFACGHTRVVLEGTKFLFHHSKVQFYSDSSWEFTMDDLEHRLSELKKHNKFNLKRCLTMRLEHSNPCKISPQQLNNLIETGENKELIINAQKAKKLGLVDVVIKKISSLHEVEKKLMNKFKNKKNNK